MYIIIVMYIIVINNNKIFNCHLFIELIYFNVINNNCSNGYI